MLINLFFSSLPLLFSSFKGLFFSLQHRNKMKKGSQGGTIWITTCRVSTSLFAAKVSSTTCLAQSGSSQIKMLSKTEPALTCIPWQQLVQIGFKSFDTNKDCDGARLCPVTMFHTCQTSIPTYCKGFRTYRSGSSSNSAKYSLINVGSSVQDSVQRHMQ